MYRLSKSLATKRKCNAFIQPSVDHLGNEITSTEQQLESWAVFLEDKFAARPNEPVIDLSEPGNAENIPDISFEEIEACVSKQKRNKATGPDGIPIEQHQYSQAAIHELHNILLSIFQTEVIPDDMVIADMMMHYKMKRKDNRAN